jgi:all-trans-retinol 13,14-reductase
MENRSSSSASTAIAMVTQLVANASDMSPATAAALSGVVVAGCVLVRSLTNKASLPPSERLNFEDKSLRKRFCCFFLTLPHFSFRSIRNKFSAKKLPSGDIDTVIIGSGMGSLSCAAILARLGHRVLVLEQHNDVAGGGTHQYDIQGYRFDSGLHYTVPWSVPIFALTTGKNEKDVCPFELTGDPSSTADRIFLHPPASPSSPGEPFDMKLHETHLQKLYADYPEERVGIEEYLSRSDDAMFFVKLFIGLRLFPKWLQRLLWKLVPSRVMAVVSQTAEELLPKLSSNKKLISLLSSMWIDTGARPDKATFMLTASVFRGISMEGGAYPSEGSESMAMELANTIQSHGGSILVRAAVEEIVYDESGNKLLGVRVRRSLPNAQPASFESLLKSNDREESQFIPCRRVVSGAGYVATFDRLVPQRVLSKYGVPRRLEVDQSAGFVMANIGFSDIDPEALGIHNLNTWHIPVDASGDLFPKMKTYFADPLGDRETGFLNIPAFITFPSLKDKAWAKAHPGKLSCQMLMMADYSWFEPLQREINEAVSARDEKRWAAAVEQLEQLKEQWKHRARQILLLYFPQLEKHIDLLDLSTPLAIENYLCAYRGLSSIPFSLSLLTSHYLSVCLLRWSGGSGRDPQEIH